MLADAPTERLPMYSHVLEQWFSEPEDAATDNTAAFDGFGGFENDTALLDTIPATRTPNARPAPLDEGRFTGLLDEPPTDKPATPVMPALSVEERAELDAHRPSYEVMEAVLNGLKRLSNAQEPPPQT